MTRFERDLKPYAEPVDEKQLVEGLVYFAVNFMDEAMLVPVMETVVFIGRDLEPGDVDRVYFQDVESYESGVRKDDDSNEPARFYSGSKNEVKHIFDYEHALDQLLACALRRRVADRK